MIDYNGRRFRSAAQDSVVARYHQQGNLVWAHFAGGNVRRGTVNGTCDAEGVLSLGYTMVLHDGEVICGYTRSTPIPGPEGRISLREEWRRYGPNAATGTSYLEELW